MRLRPICILFAFLAIAVTTFAQDGGAEARTTAPPASLTFREVSIDPLGADPDTPWTVHTDTLDVHAEPSYDSPVVGTLSRDAAVVGAYCVIVETDEEWLRITGGETVGWAPRTGLHRVHPKNADAIAAHGNLPFGSEIVIRWWGIPIGYEADDLVSLPEGYAGGRDPEDYRLRREAAEHAVAMIDAAAEAGIEIYASSPYRSGTTQQGIYLRNVERRGLSQRFSAPPGHSEHQLGTTMDIAARSTGRFLTKDCPEHLWMQANGARFGFRQTYREDNIDATGYVEEPWHWRYMGVERTAPSGDATAN